MERNGSVLKIQISPAEFRADVENRSFSGNQQTLEASLGTQGTGPGGGIGQTGLLGTFGQGLLDNHLRKMELTVLLCHSLSRGHGAKQNITVPPNQPSRAFSKTTEGWTLREGGRMTSGCKG